MFTKKAFVGTRARTTAEILIETDHLGANDDCRNEPTDPALVTMKNWLSFMNYKHLPAVIDRYGCGYVDQRNLWKRHLTERGLAPSALLKDGVHLNDEGCRVMAAFVKAGLVKRDEPTPGPMNCGYVKTYLIGRDVKWNDGRLKLDFEGNRVDLIAAQPAKASVYILIDGKKPSEHSELYAFTRALAKPGGKWPVIANLSFEKPLLLEDWTMQVRREGADEKLYSFTLTGSKTGADGEGRSDARFISKSGRIILDPEDWDVTYALALSGIKPVPENFMVKWSLSPQFKDDWQPSAVPTGIENCTTIAHGLRDTRHTLELSGDQSSVTAIRIYSPQKFPR